jgi:CDP-paratose 2-epimerase
MVIGGAGFIGCNTARRFLQRGDRVLVVDNLARRGSRANLEWLRGQGDVDFTQCDIRDYGQLTEVFENYRNIDVVVHLAAQVAVTTSVEEPREDFDINALGTFNVLEAVRNGTSDPLLIFASTNKVYGGMEDITIVPAEGAGGGRKGRRTLTATFREAFPRIACSIFILPMVAPRARRTSTSATTRASMASAAWFFRQSCIYGPRQFGIEDQGWVAWFTISAAVNRKLNIYAMASRFGICCTSTT